MGTRTGDGIRRSKVFALVAILLFSFVNDIPALSVTVNDEECVYEYVLYENDTISGNFVVVDHDIFWSSDHPGIDFIVRIFFLLCLTVRYFSIDLRITCEQFYRSTF